MFRVLMLIALLFAPVMGSATKENPMRKIISMLQDMQKELEREGELEKEIFDKAICACEGGTDHLSKAIADSTSSIEELTAKVASGTAEKTQLTQDVADHKTSAASAKSDLDEATMLREKESKQFSATEKDTKTNLDGLSKAIPAIEKGMGGAALMQMPGQEMKMEKLRRFVEVTKLLGNDDRSNVLAFLDQGSDDQESSNTQTQGAGEILGILKNMKDEMEKDLSELVATEKRDHESFNELKAAKTNEIGLNEKAVIEKEKRIGGLALALSEDSHALEDATEEKANAEKFLANMKEQCATVEKDKAMRMKMRADEIAAISEAVNILNDDDALEVFSKAKASAALVQKKKTYDALLQLMSQKGVKVVPTHRHRQMLLLSVKQTKKEEPMSTAEASGGAEKLVSHMIDGMVGVLHDEDVGDEHKKAWCANETTIAHAIEVEKEEKIEKTKTEIAEQEDELATTIAEIKALTAKIAELDKMVHEATENRKEQHQEFVDSFATSATALRLIDKAIKRLEKFYSPQKVAKAVKETKDAALAKAGLSLLHKKADQPEADPALVAKLASKMLPADFDALVQVHEHTATEAAFAAELRDGVDPVVIPDTPKTYEKKESGGVIGLMTEFKTDLKTDMTESETEEKFMAKEYVRVMTDAKETRDQDVKSKNEKEAHKASLDQKLVDNRAKLSLTEEELHNLQLYLVQLHTECDFLMRNFEVRHEGRVDEETGLETAETIVTDAEPPSHKDIEKRFKEEHTDDDVDEHFPGTPIDDGPDNAH
jgi:septal ring factor EnvC (AmiA/AmiB activator)